MGKKRASSDAVDEQPDDKAGAEEYELKDEADNRKESGGDSATVDEAPKRKRKRNRSRKKPEAAEAVDGAATAADAAGGGAPPPHPLPSPSVESTVYCEGISYDAEDADVRALFEQVGPVEALRMPRWHDSGKPRGYAHVVFAEPSDVAKAIAQLHKQRLMGRYLTVSLPKAPRQVSGGPKAPPPQGCKTLFVKNLPYDCDEQGVRALLGAYGEVKDVRLAVAHQPDGGVRLKGFGYVQFASEGGVGKAAAAANAGTLVMGGRHLRVDFDGADSRPKASFRRTDGSYWREDTTM